jgi:arsenite methyltransferase
MTTMPELLVDPEALRMQVRERYREVATDPGRDFHFHTGRALAARLGYDETFVAALPERAGEGNARAFDVYGYAFIARKPW